MLRPLHRFSAALLVAGALVLAGVSPAAAVVTLAVTPNVPSSLTVGQTAPGTLTIMNQSNGADAPLNVAVNSITLVPSCGAPGVDPGNCPIASRDSGVMGVSAVSGRAGTACADRTWTPADPDTTQGKFAFVPSVQPVLGPAMNGGPLATCVLDFTIEVLRAPARDAAPQPGLQTHQVGFVSAQTLAPPGQAPRAGRATGTSQTTVAGQSPVTISAQAAPAAVTLGSAIHATATLATPDANPTGTITFALFGPDDAACGGAPVFISAKPVAAKAATSDDFTPNAAGTYRFRASYDGDASNLAAGPSACDDASAAAVVSSPAPAPPAPGPATPAGATAVAPGATLAGNAASALASQPGVRFTTPPKTVRVSRTGSFSFAFTATPGTTGKIGLKSAKKVKIGTKTKLMRVAAKTFTPTAAGAVSVKYKLSSANLKALKRLKSLKFGVTAVLGGKSFTTTVTLTPPKTPGR